MRDERGELKTVTDSTPIIRRLEDEFEGRSVIPEDPALCNYLLEDFGDEWVTKYMFIIDGTLKKMLIMLLQFSP